MEEPVFNKELNLLNQKQYLITNNEIHKKFVFVKDDNSRAHGDIKYNLDFITKNINIENNENDINNQNENRNVNMLDLGCYGNIKIMKKKIINILDYKLECYIK